MAHGAAVAAELYRSGGASDRDWFASGFPRCVLDDWAFLRFVLAMAHRQKGEKDEARKWFDKAVARTRENDHGNSELRQLWAEAADLLGQPGPDVPAPAAPKAPAVEKPR